MSEVSKQPEWQSSIERYDKKLTVQIGNKATVFSYHNTNLYEYPEAYEQFDHAFRVNDDGETGVYWLRSGSAELWDALVEHDFPRHTLPYPTTQDEKVIMKRYDAKLHEGLEELLEGSDE